MNRTILFYQIILDGLLFREIKEFLNITIISVNELLNASSNFKELKRNILIGNSHLYHISSPYRKRITLLVNTKSQLSLKLNGFFEVVDVSVLADIHTLDLSLCIHISDVSLLGGVHSLDLSYCQ
jgi:hypothetical protein